MGRQAWELGRRYGALALAVGLLAVMAFFTLAPLSLRPRTGLVYGLEHFISFGLVGAAAALSRTGRSARAIALALAVIALIELLQLAVPGRHARPLDALMNATGYLGGLGLAGAARLLVARRGAAR